MFFANQPAPYCFPWLDQESLEAAVCAVHHAILCADEVGGQSAKEIVLEEGDLMDLFIEISTLTG